MKPTICIANSSHVVVLNNYLQEENICLLSRRVWPYVKHANNSYDTLILSRIPSRYARLNIVVGSSDGRWQMVAQFDKS